MNNSESDPAARRHEAHRASCEATSNAGASRRESRELRPRHSMSRLRLIGTSGLAMVLVGTSLLGCSRKSPDDADESATAEIAAPAVVEVLIRNLQFSPLTIEVRKGDAIEWKNEDIVPHTATSASFDSGPILSGQSWRHTFVGADTISYVCTFHPQMKGTVIVK